MHLDLTCCQAWILFRHKHPKRTFHYFKLLKRPVARAWSVTLSILKSSSEIATCQWFATCP